MSLDKSLKVKDALVRRRNVLRREERILRLMEEDKWSDESSPFGLAKTRVKQISTGKKKKAEAPAATATDDEEKAE